jgi:hypothetical protein
MASYKQSQTNYPYFCLSGPSTRDDYNLTQISTSNTFWNSTSLEKGSDSVTINSTDGLKFTAPVSGLYYFKISFCCLNNSATGDDSGIWGITITRASPLSNSTRFIGDNPENISTEGTEYNSQFSTIAHLNAGDTVKMYTDGGFSSVQDYFANRSFFMGYLIAGFN